MSTKALILETATALFNQHGTAKTSTNHIAEEAGISPGNLYYHYQDKAHIIREIYEQLIKDWETPYLKTEIQEVSTKVVEQFAADNFELLWKYRFFNREKIALLNTDTALAQRHFTKSKEHFERQRLLFQQVLHFPEQGMQLDELITIVWIVANHYLIHLESIGQEVEESDFHKGAKLIMRIFSPHMR